MIDVSAIRSFQVQEVARRGVPYRGGLAVFTDSAPSSTNTFTTGSLDIDLTDANETDTDAVTASISFSDMIPGDSVTSTVTVSNNGSLALRYALTAAATNVDTKALRDELTLVIKTIDATTPGSPCNDFDGTQLSSTDLDGAAGVLFGDVAQGAQAGDRAVAAAADDVLCFRVTLPLAAPNSVQSAATTATFTFQAEQTANN